MAAVHEAGATPDASVDSVARQKVSIEKLKLLIDDETFRSLKRHFLMQGKGRRPDLPADIKVTNRLLVQVHQVKEDGQCSFAHLQEWLCRLEPNLASVSKSRINHHVTSVVKACLQLTEQEIMLFLEKPFDFHALPVSLSSFGLNRLHLLDQEAYICASNTVITNDVIRALEHFQVKENLPMSFVVKWIKRLDPVTVSESESRLRSKVLSMCKRIRALVKNKKTKDLEHLLCQPFHCPNPVPSSPRLAKDNSSLGKEFKTLKKANEVLVSKISGKDLQIAVLKDEREDLRHENEQVNHIQDLLEQNIKQNKALKRKIKEKEEQLDQQAQSRTYTLNANLKREIKAAVEQIEELNNENEDLKGAVHSVKSKFKHAKEKSTILEKQVDERLVVCPTHMLL